MHRLLLFIASIICFTNPGHAVAFVYEASYSNLSTAFYDQNGWKGWKDVSSWNSNLPIGLGWPDGWPPAVAFYGAHSTWLINQSKARDRIAIVQEEYRGKKILAASFTVKPGDNVGYTGERAELSGLLDDKGRRLPPVTETSRVFFYAVSVKLSEHWKSPSPDKSTGPVWGIFAQLVTPSVYNSPPALALVAEEKFRLRLCVGDLLEGGRDRNKDSIPLEFSDGTLARGTWVDFLIEVRWSAHWDGALTVFRRDEGESDFRRVVSYEGPTLAYRPGTASDGGHNWKIGFYRSSSPQHENSLRLRSFYYSDSRAEILDSAFR